MDKADELLRELIAVKDMESRIGSVQKYDETTFALEQECVLRGTAIWKAVREYDTAEKGGSQSAERPTGSGAPDPVSPATASAQQTAQPVAWMYEPKDGRSWIQTWRVSMLDENHTETPLYAVQPPRDQTHLRNTARAYEELIYAVHKVFPNESRHETALRYIREREAPNNEAKAASQAQPSAPKSEP